MYFQIRSISISLDFCVMLTLDVMLDLSFFLGNAGCVILCVLFGVAFPLSISHSFFLLTAYLWSFLSLFYVLFYTYYNFQRPTLDLYVLVSIPNLWMQFVYFQRYIETKKVRQREKGVGGGCNQLTIYFYYHIRLHTTHQGVVTLALNTFCVLHNILA